VAIDFHHHHHHLYSSKTHNTKAVIENGGQNKLGNSTYNCPKNRHKSIKGDMQWFFTNLMKK